MKKNLLFLMVAVLLVYACSKKNTDVGPGSTDIKKPIDLSSYALMGLDSPFLLPDTANVMIQSYLNARGTNDVKSYRVDANSLRYYLQNTNITHVRLMFAHKLSYVHGGGKNIYDGLDYESLTIVIAGLDSNNNYIYSPQGAVMDFCEPCPTHCPSSGTGASDLLNN
ncbi:MAG: hypothetical protein H6550_01075 [Chitinophagales bacterium]|nr:hypothetical protein [Chitinophagales bacterium]